MQADRQVGRWVDKHAAKQRIKQAERQAGR